MGSALSRHLRDLGDVGGFETLYGSVSEPAKPLQTEFKSSSDTDSCPATPTSIQPIQVVDFDPRSPTAEIVRTPIEVGPKFSPHATQDSPLVLNGKIRTSYLETDLDTLSTSELAKRPSEFSNEEESSLPPGLSCAHLMKLRFLGIDPRSPSNNVVRTPIQIGKTPLRSRSPLHFDDTVSVGSLSSQDLFNNSICSSEFTRDCSDPSALISELEDGSEKEDEDYVSTTEEEPASKNDELKDGPPLTFVSDQIPESRDGVFKAGNKLQVFQEKSVIKCDNSEKLNLSTPEGTKKVATNRSRTPLTPICNKNRTPNSILRAKQSQTIEKEILTKVKIFSSDDKIFTPCKIRPFGSSKKENLNLHGRSNRKGLATNNENLENSSAMKQVPAQWDHDTSVVI
ncbi:C4-dicarboxylate transport protein [Frankliniella fusca]|uniref:C4-dicarboxylate transport protein n=1 Tax=Frankliniella fusca TaxID=407009 RepID=A0AAE1HC17_9NEOP|nr:C4-dicarboxylate transport protein [Frankliniella fusca]